MTLGANRPAHWGQNVTILDEEGIADLPVVVRRAKAFEKTLLDMPIDIEADDLIVGNTVENGVIVRPRLVTYNTEEERAQAAAQGVKVRSGLAHKTPSYDALMSQGLNGILREMDDKLEEIEQIPRHGTVEHRRCFPGKELLEAQHRGFTRYTAAQHCAGPTFVGQE